MFIYYSHIDITQIRRSYELPKYYSLKNTTHQPSKTCLFNTILILNIKARKCNISNIGNSINIMIYYVLEKISKIDFAYFSLEISKLEFNVNESTLKLYYNYFIFLTYFNFQNF